jgi:3-deoxy-D-manno-octulosonate 8-phosphate phosphatase KdsC-like HAD superfamily phosphatase|tara:strand:- start:367 stop:579 length:213 start_codon:yes stop_codon:yes gene_type:complete
MEYLLIAVCFILKVTKNLKKFNIRDKIGVKLLKQNRINTIFVTKENSKFFSSTKKLQTKIFFEIENKEKN